MDKSDIDKEHVIEELSYLLAHICNVSNYLYIEVVHEVEDIQIECIEGLIISFVGKMPYLKNKTFVSCKIFVILTKYIRIVYTLGFNIEELEEAYYKKLKVNYERF